MRFIVDSMMGNLARWLRVFGYDTSYASNIDDDEILEASIREFRTIISRDRLLCQRSSFSIFIDNTDLDKQLLLILSRNKPDVKTILTRCLECNDVLEPVSKEQVASAIPESVKENHVNFWRCPGCSKIYWKGSHYDKMRGKVDNLLAQCES